MDFSMTLTGYHQQAHFKANELELYFNMTPPKGFPKCNHIPNLFCSKGDKLQPEECTTVQKCLLLKFKDQLFQKYGIHGPTLLKVDKILRETKSDERE